MRLTHIALLVALTLACGDSTGPQTVDVAVRDDTFAPSTVTVPLGSTIRWAWAAENQNAHDLSWDAAGVPGVEAQPAGTYERQFMIAGTFTYFCAIHTAQNMRGTVTVQ